MASHTLPVENIGLENLDDSMIILRYIGFSRKFNAMDDTTCQWLKLNFRSVRARIKRGNDVLDISIEHVQVGDELIELHTFPPSLKKLTLVNQRLIQELKKRGFLKFRVQRIKKQLTLSQAKHRENVLKSSELIQKAKESVVVSKGATKAIENLIDDSRHGKLDLGDMSDYVDKIINNGATEALGIISSLKKSDQTYAHCIDVGAIFQSTYVKMMEREGTVLTPKQSHRMLLGAFMHDIGKAKVPKDILDSTARFERDSPEMKLMQSHPVFGAEILTKLGSSDTIINMAHYHHVKMDTEIKSSYPQASYQEVYMETRLIAIVDVYQALVGRRSYKKSWAPPAAIQFLGNLSGIEFDTDAWDSFFQIMGQFPVGSLVELSDGSLAFVVQPAEKDLNRPRVALIRNVKGEDLTHNTLIDLQEEPEIKIVRDLDNYEVLGDASLEIFTSLRIT
ncbi:HD domain-containing protein [bacterium]|nr:HD domain-containing protein [bacterium]